MKKVSKKLITSVLTLVLTVIALGTTTFAWFSLSTVSNIGNITGNVVVGDGLEVRLTSGAHETAWKSNLSDADIEAFIVGTQAKPGIFYEKAFEAVTAKTLGTFKKAGITDNGNIWIDKDNATANEDFIEFTIEFRSLQEGTILLESLTIGGASQNFTVDGDPYVQTVGGGLTNNQITTSAAYGARVSIGDDVFQLKDGSGNIAMTDDAIEAGQWSYLYTSKGLRFYSDNDTTEIAAPLTEVIIAATENNDTSAVEIVLDAPVAPSKYYTASTTVRIWIEGWDADSYDSIYNAELIVSMIFKKKEVVVGP